MMVGLIDIRVDAFVAQNKVRPVFLLAGRGTPNDRPAGWTISLCFKNESRLPIALSGEIKNEDEARSAAARFSEISGLPVVESQELQQVPEPATVYPSQGLSLSAAPLR